MAKVCVVFNNRRIHGTLSIKSYPARQITYSCLWCSNDNAGQCAGVGHYTNGVGSPSH